MRIFLLSVRMFLCLMCGVLGLSAYWLMGFVSANWLMGFVSDYWLMGYIGEFSLLGNLSLSISCSSV